MSVVEQLISPANQPVGTAILEQLKRLIGEDLRSASRHPESQIHAAADKHLNAMTVAVMYGFLKGRKALRGLLKTLGDSVGHEFHGNQYTAGTGERSFGDLRWRTETGEKAKEGDVPPERTKMGDYIVYHGTSQGAVDSIKQTGLKADNIGAVGFATTPGSAQMMGGFHGKDSATLRLVVDKTFMEKQAHVTHESNAKDLFLLHHPEGDRMHVPPSAIKSISTVRRLEAFRTAVSAADISACVSTIRAALLVSLPPVLLKVFVAGGNAGIGMLPKRLRAAGDVPGHEFHGNQYTLPVGVRDTPENRGIKWEKQGAHFVNAEPVTLYHGTTESRATKIESEGLKFGNLTPKPEYAAEMARIRREGEKPIVFKVEAPRGSVYPVFGGPKAIRTDALALAKPITSVMRHASFRILRPQVKGQSHDVVGPYGIAFNVDSEEAIAWAEEHAGELAKNLSATSEQAIKDAVADALEGDGIDAAYDTILAAVGDATRAEMIARTEIMTAANAGLSESWSQAVDAGLLTGNEKKEWIATSEACPICDEMDGEQVGLDESFDFDGEMIDGPPGHPRCRCTMGLAMDEV